MDPLVNRRLFETVNFDSATPVAGAAVVHRFDAEGQYVLSVTRAERVVETRAVTVLPRPALAGSEAVADPQPDVYRLLEAVPIDLGTPAGLPGLAPRSEPLSRLTLVASGLAVFNSPPDQPNGAVVHQMDADGGVQDPVFNTAELNGDDLFVVTLVRPGTYTMRNTVGGQGGQVVVTYPVVGDAPYRPADPVDVQVTDSGFQPDSLTIGPGQGVIFHMTTPSRVTVDLETPDDGPAAEEMRAQPRARWVAPVSGDPGGGRDGGPQPAG